MNSLISIIIPVYNVSKYVDACLASIVRQDYSNIEIIIINDGSTDDSWEKCLVWQKKDNRITCITQCNLGVSVARNKGINIAKGEYIVFVDSDDIVEPHYVSSLYHTIELAQSDMAVAFIDTIDNPNNIIPNDIPDIAYRNEAMHLLCMGKIHTGAVAKIYKTELVKETPFVEGMVYEDNLFTFEIIGKCEKVAFCKTFLYHYVTNLGSITHTYSSKYFWDMIKAFELVVNYLGDFYQTNSSDYITRKFTSWAALKCELQKKYKKSITKEEYNLIHNKLNKMRKELICDLKNIKKLNLPLKARLKLFLIKYIPELYYPIQTMWIVVKKLL